MVFSWHPVHPLWMLEPAFQVRVSTRPFVFIWVYPTALWRCHCDYITERVGNLSHIDSIWWHSVLQWIHGLRVIDLGQRRARAALLPRWRTAQLPPPWWWCRQAWLSTYKLYAWLLSFLCLWMHVLKERLRACVCACVHVSWDCHFFN